jgi:hypothetical protein
MWIDTVVEVAQVVQVVTGRDIPYDQFVSRPVCTIATKLAGLLIIYGEDRAVLVDLTKP